MSLEKVISLLKQKRNIFITGPGGTGKSWIVRQLVELYPKNFTITSSTGISAYNLFPTAKTIHKFSGLGTRQFEDIHYTDKKLWDEYIEYTLLGMSEGKKRNIKYCGYLVIDEISMISKGFFDLMNEVFKRIKESDKPLGGMGVIITGDFLQLPSVVKRDKEADYYDDFVQYYAFDSLAWKEINPEIVYLSEIKRSTNPEWIKMLNQVRLGFIDDEFFFKLKRSANNTIGDKATNLVAMNRKADTINEAQLEKINQPLLMINAKWRGDKEELKDVKAGVLAKDILKLKMGCRVMIIINEREYGDNEPEFNDEGIEISSASYVNGSQGVFLGFKKRETRRDVNIVELDPITGILKIYKGKREFEVAVIVLDNGEHVELKRNSWNNGVKEWNKDTGVDQWQVEFSQYPIILAYSVTIHKAQGLTIPKLEIDCNGIFTTNQFYVAISRGTSFETVCVKNLREKHVNSCPRAIAFYKNITDKLGDEHTKTSQKPTPTKEQPNVELQTNV
jgi:ATP-dependent DNA helicase PIF1